MNSRLLQFRPLIGLLSIAVLIAGGIRITMSPSQEIETAEGPASNAVDTEGQSSSAEGPTAGAGEGGALPGSGTSGASTAAARPFGAPKPGQYRYRYSTSGGRSEPRSEEQVLKIEDLEVSASQVRQSMTLDAKGGSGRQEVVWRSDGNYLMKEGGKSGETEVECDWEPDILNRKLPLAKGAEWSYDTTCTFTIQGVNGNRHRTGKARVTDRRRVDVAGQSVDAFVIDQTFTETASFGEFTANTESSSTDYFSAEHGLSVKSVGKTKTTVAAQTRESSIEVELLTLNPF